MNKPSSGFVTFLFTDIEGSTKLAQDFPDTLQIALEKHHTILHKATESNNGFVYEIVGDAFCCAFENAEDAIKAAIHAQINLANENWGDVRIKIRIGLHSGNVEWNGKRYMGYITLARTARIMSAAYGEQIIISNDVYELAKEKIPNIISFRDLGERRLKDLKQPIRLFQIQSKGLREDFPPLNTLDARPNNLPVQLTSFIGKDAEMKLVKDLLKKTHLLTLTGSGGAGKTRFALQVGADVIDDFANGVWFVELASISDPALLPQTFLKVFELKEEPKINPEDTLCDYLKDKEMLIILDNCEHLVETCAKLVEKLLSISPKLIILATSREGLRCVGEQTHRVLSLEIPDPKNENTPEQLSQYEAVRLFIERALAVDDTFRIDNNNAPALAEICYQLDGIPLAIELAAVRTKVLTVEQIYERLNNSFNLLTGGKRTALPRQQTLRALIDWSYDLLSEKEQVLWRRLSLFVGGWTLDAGEEICSDEKIKKEDVLELLNQLGEKSIIIFESAKERYRMLETIRRYGSEKFNEVSESENIFLKYLNYFMKLSELAEPKLTGNESQIWLSKLEIDHENLQSAIYRSMNIGEKEKCIRIACSMWRFWDIRGYYSIGKGLLENIYDKSQGISNFSMARILFSLGSIITYQGELDKANKFLEKSLLIRRKVGEKIDIAATLRNLGHIAYEIGNYEQAKEYYDESLLIEKDIGDKQGLSISLNNLSGIENKQGNYEQAKKFCEESLKLSLELGDKRAIAKSLHNLGYTTLYFKNFEQAKKYMEKSLILYRELLDKRGTAGSLNGLGNIAYDLGNYDQALRYLEESLLIKRNIGDKYGIAYSLNELGIVESTLENYKQAQKYYEESLYLRRGMGDKHGICESFYGLGTIAFNQLKYDQAWKFWKESLSLLLELGDKSGIALILIGIAGILNESNQLSHAILLIGAVESSLESIGNILHINDINQQKLLVNKTQEKLPSEKFSKYFDEGKKLTLEQAAELALSIAQNQF